MLRISHFLFPLFAAAIFVASSSARAELECADIGEWLAKPCDHLVQTYRDGNNEVLLSGFAWHLPTTYTYEKRHELNQIAAGFGMGRTIEEANGDTRSVFAMAFLDSHKNIEWQAGYTWSTFWGPREGIQVGLGYAAMIVQRPDVFHGIPFPGALPLFTFRYKKASLVTTYIPTLGGSVNNGSVIYFFGRYTLD